MTPEPKYSERDLILAQRGAFKDSVRYVAENNVKPHDSGIGCTICDKQAAERYPLPKVTRPRVVVDPNTACCRWRVVKSGLQWSLSDSAWRLYPERLPESGSLVAYVTAERAALWADLLANPTEEVSDE